MEFHKTALHKMESLLRRWVMGKSLRPLPQGLALPLPYGSLLKLPRLRLLLLTVDSRIAPQGLARPLRHALPLLPLRQLLRQAQPPLQHGARVVRRARDLLPATRPPCPLRAPTSLGLRGCWLRNR